MRNGPNGSPGVKIDSFNSSHKPYSPGIFFKKDSSRGLDRRDKSPHPNLEQNQALDTPSKVLNTEVMMGGIKFDIDNSESEKSK